MCDGPWQTKYIHFHFLPKGSFSQSEEMGLTFKEGFVHSTHFLTTYRTYSFIFFSIRYNCLEAWIEMSFNSFCTSYSGPFFPEMCKDVPQNISCFAHAVLGGSSLHVQMCMHTNTEAWRCLCVKGWQEHSILQVSSTVLPWNKEHCKSLSARGSCPWAAYLFSPLIKQK